ncbi:hypothetical protein QUA00_25575 [Microcoleus sp. T2B6]
MFAIEWSSLNAPTPQLTSNRNLLGSSQGLAIGKSCGETKQYN